MNNVITANRPFEGPRESAKDGGQDETVAAVAFPLGTRRRKGRDGRNNVVPLRTVHTCTLGGMLLSNISRAADIFERHSGAARCSPAVSRIFNVRRDAIRANVYRAVSFIPRNINGSWARGLRRIRLLNSIHLLKRITPLSSAHLRGISSPHDISNVDRRSFLLRARLRIDEEEDFPASVN